MRGKKDFYIGVLARHLLQPPTSIILYRVGLPPMLLNNKHIPHASCPQQPPQALQEFSFEKFGRLHYDTLTLLNRHQGLLNQAVIVHADVEGYYVVIGVTFMIATATGC